MKSQSTWVSLFAGLVIGLLIAVPVTFLYATPLQAQIVSEENAEQNQQQTQTNSQTSTSQTTGQNSGTSNTSSASGGSTTSTTTPSVSLNNAVVTGVSGSTITVSVSGASYSIGTNSSTKFSRDFGSVSNISEISLNDILNISGSWANTSHTVFSATSITNTSIQTTTFTGTIKSVNIGQNTMTINTLEGNMNLDISTTNTVITDKNGNPTAPSNLNVGDTATVSGVWDRANNSVTPIFTIEDTNISV